MKKRRNGIQIYIALIIAILVVYAVYFNHNKNRNTIKQESPVKTTPVIELSVIQARKQTVELTYEFPARTFPYKISDIRPQINGVIVKQMFTEGSFIKKGDKLYQIDPSEKITILAPISGYIGRSFITEGSLVTQNQTTPLATITQLDPIYVDISVPSNQITEIQHHNDKKVILFINDKQYPYTGLLKFSETVINPNTGSTVFRAIFKNPNNELLLGMYVKVNIILKVKDIITIPQHTVQHTPNGEKYVWVVNAQGIIHKKMVKIGQSLENKWIIESGIQNGDLILYEGFQKIREDLKIQPKIIKL